MNLEQLEQFVRSLDGIIAAYKQHAILNGSNEKARAIVGHVEDARLGIVEQMEEIEEMERKRGNICARCGKPANGKWHGGGGLKQPIRLCQEHGEQFEREGQAKFAKFREEHNRKVLQQRGLLDES